MEGRFGTFRKFLDTIIVSHKIYEKKKFHSVIFSFGYINYIIDPTAVIINSTNYTNTDKIE